MATKTVELLREGYQAIQKAYEERYEYFESHFERDDRYEDYAVGCGCVEVETDFMAKAWFEHGVRPSEVLDVDGDWSRSQREKTDEHWFEMIGIDEDFVRYLQEMKESDGQ